MKDGSYSGSQYCLQLSLLQQIYGKEAVESAIVTILLAVITVATVEGVYVSEDLGAESQYCLQLSLLQQQGFKTLALSGF